MNSNCSVHNSYTIQPAAQSDLPLLNAIEAAAGAIFPPGYLPEHILAESVLHEVLLEAMNQGRLLVAVDAAQVPVCYAFWQTVAGSALLAQMDVHPLHGRKGIGSALLTQIIEQVAKAGFQHLYLTTFSDVPWNVPFYQKLGFALLDVENQPDFIRGILRDEQARGLSKRVAMRYAIPPT